MDLNIILGIIAIIVAIVIPLYLSSRDRSKTKIYFYRSQYFRLYDELTKNIPDLEIKYKGNQIQSNMFFLKGVFICSGKKDIASADIQKGITLTIRGNDARWHDSKVINKTDDLDITFGGEDSKLLIDFPSLKDKEYFILESLGQCDELLVDMNHRITNVPDIVQRIVGQEKETKRSLFMGLTTVVFCLFALFVVQSTISVFEYEPTYFNKKNIVVKESDAVDTIWLHTEMNNPYNGKDSIAFLSMLKSEPGFPITKTLRFDEDSVRKLAMKEYSKSDLIFSSPTKTYRLSENFSVNYKLDIQWPELIFYTIMISGLLLTIIFITKEGISYNRDRKVSNLASKLLN